MPSVLTESLVNLIGRFTDVVEGRSCHVTSRQELVAADVACRQKSLIRSGCGFRLCQSTLDSKRKPVAGSIACLGELSRDKQLGGNAAALLISR